MQKRQVSHRVGQGAGGNEGAEVPQVARRNEKTCWNADMPVHQRCVGQDSPGIQFSVEILPASYKLFLYILPRVCPVTGQEFEGRWPVYQPCCPHYSPGGGSGQRGRGSWKAVQDWRADIGQRSRGCKIAWRGEGSHAALYFIPEIDGDRRQGFKAASRRQSELPRI